MKGREGGQGLGEGGQHWASAQCCWCWQWDAGDGWGLGLAGDDKMTTRCSPPWDPRLSRTVVHEDFVPRGFLMPWEVFSGFRLSNHLHLSRQGRWSVFPHTRHALFKNGITLNWFISCVWQCQERARELETPYPYSPGSWPSAMQQSTIEAQREWGCWRGGRVVMAGDLGDIHPSFQSDQCRLLPLCLQSLRPGIGTGRANWICTKGKGLADPTHQPLPSHFSSEPGVSAQCRRFWSSQQGVGVTALPGWETFSVIA